MKSKTVKVGKLICDFTLWPRDRGNSLDGSNLKRIKDALRAGIELPPVIVNRADNRVIDGFHRTHGTLAVLGPDAPIKVTYRDYSSEADMFADSLYFNASQGLTLSAKDRVFAFHKARKYKMPPAKIGYLLGMKPEEVQEFVRKRTAYAEDGSPVALPGGAAELAGKTLTRDQEERIRGINGVKASVNAKILLNELSAGAYASSVGFRDLLVTLRDKIDQILSKMEDIT